MQSFDDYLAASARDSSYGSPLEVEALARVFDVQIILIPCIADFAVMSFRTSQAKRVLVLWVPRQAHRSFDSEGGRQKIPGSGFKHHNWTCT